MKHTTEGKRANGKKCGAVMVNKRVGVTYRFRKIWIGLIIDFGTGEIVPTRLKSAKDAKEFLTLRYVGRRVKIGGEKEEFDSD
ncbi:MAG TPA: hypothetical protein VMU16_01075 [Candidatus Binataceae bacterium]|nr:hypothetical protein [Candidatus Binataceae bacterium]